MGVGKVYIVGAGPGAPDLISLRGYRFIRQADLLICDNLLERSFLDDLDIPAGDKEVEWLGDGADRKTQDEVNRLMLDAAMEGKVVVRLKVGDPFIFGRGNEEVEFLTEHGIKWEVVPGSSVCTAALSAAGLPLTWREDSRSFAVVTARCAGGPVNTAWPRADTIVILMGVAVISEVVESLMEDGWGRDTPAAVLERATIPWERRAEGKLSEIAEMAQTLEIASPAALIVGAAALRRHAFQKRPTILFAGLDPSNFRILGDIIHWPAIKLVREEGADELLSEAISKLGMREFDWIIFTSRAGVKFLFEGLRRHGLDARSLAGTRIAAAGTGTAQRLSEHGLCADVVAEEPGSRGILSETPELDCANVLLIQGSHAPQDLVSELARRGCSVFRVALHRAVPHPELGRPLPKHDIIYFTSSSGVRAYRDTYGEDAFRMEVWCIGEITAAQVRDLGFEAKVVNPYVPVDEDAKKPAF